MTIKPLPSWATELLEKILGYLISTALFPVFLLLWLAEFYERNFEPQPGTWQRWYAWWPTRLGRYDGECGVVWLEPVERTRWGAVNLYRRPEDTTIRASWEYPEEE